MNSKRARRHLSKSRRALAWQKCRPVLCATLIAIAPPARADAPHVPDPIARTEIAGYANLARKAADEGKWPLADHFLGLLSKVKAPDSEKKTAFRSLADDYEKRHNNARAIAILEKMAQTYPDDADTPELVFHLGLLYRESGVPKIAITRFYSVLNSALKFGSTDLAAYKTLAQRAQWEIAETFFLTGDYSKAQKYYELVSRLDLPPPELARVRFKLAHCHFIVDDVPGAIAAAQVFLKDFPDDPSAAECRYLLARAYRTQHRNREAFDAVLALLKEETTRKETAPEKWIYWKKKAGNEFANTYYQDGDALSALTIYQNIARLSEEPEWQWPVLYQMGLCFERLRYGDRAADTYKYLLEEAKKPGREDDKLPEILKTILEMARWRSTHLTWSNGAAVNLQRLLSNPLAQTKAEIPKS